MKHKDNKRSQELTNRARVIASTYTRHPEVAAVILGGSASRGTARADSDIDLGVFWSRLPNEDETYALLQQAGVQLARSEANDLRFPEECPRRNGRIEIGHLSEATEFQGRVDVAHETVKGTEKVLDQVFRLNNSTLENQELISVIREGVVLHGAKLVSFWRASSEMYPNEIARQMIRNHFLGISSTLRSRTSVIASCDWICRQKVCSDLCRRLILALMAINRMWAFTDNTDFKGLDTFVDRMHVKPPDFLRRLGYGFSDDSRLSIQMWAALICDVIDLIDRSGLDVDMTEERKTCETLAGDAAQRIESGQPSSGHITISEWHKDNTRWSELEKCIQELGQKRWFDTRCDFHLSETVIVAHTPQNVIGFLRYVVQEIGPDNELPSRKLGNEVLREGKILAYGVLPSHRNRGIGTALLAQACLVGKLAELFQLRAHSSGDHQAAHRVLMRAGFGIHPIDRNDDLEGGYFVKPLRRSTLAEQGVAADALPAVTR
jgi:ribosomal protein S18 acetylase RimI-like enzyme